MVDRRIVLKEEIANNIKKLMKLKGWNQQTLCEQSGISRSTLSDYVNARTLVNVGNVQKLADALGVSKGEIDPTFNPEAQIYIEVKSQPREPLQGDSKFKYDMTTPALDYVSETLTNYEATRELQVFGNISCGTGTVDYGQAIETVTVPTSWLNGGNYFALRAQGDSMIGARITEGDILVIREQNDAENGEIAAVLVDDEIMLKRIYKTDSSFMLISENPKYAPRIFNPDADYNIRILGKLKKAITDF